MTTTKKTKRCCGTSVGVIITDQADRMLMVTRGWWPKGTAPVAGHVKDAHTDVASALVAEVEEEVGLTVVGTPTTLWRGHLPNLCASLPAIPRPGHEWEVAAATVTGQLRPAEGETKGAAWYAREQVDVLAAATLDHYRAGGVPADQPDASLEAAWLKLLFEANRLPWLTESDLALAEKAYSTAPDEYWLGGRP